MVLFYVWPIISMCLVRSFACSFVYPLDGMFVQSLIKHPSSTLSGFRSQRRMLLIEFDTEQNDPKKLGDILTFSPAHPKLVYCRLVDCCHHHSHHHSWRCVSIINFFASRVCSFFLSAIHFGEQSRDQTQINLSTERLSLCCQLYKVTVKLFISHFN